MATSGELILELTRVVHAAPARVYAALTVPEVLATWWGPRRFSALNVEVDLRVGGQYRIMMQPPNGAAFHLRGEFREVEPDSRLAYTFNWEEPDPDDRETVVGISLRHLGNGATELAMHQGVFATEARRTLHQDGWSESLDKLERLMSATPPDRTSR